MKRILFYVCLLTAGFIVFGCNQDDGVQPDAMDEPIVTVDPSGEKGRLFLKPGRYYTNFWSNATFNYGEFSSIDTRDGEATFIWQLQSPAGGDGENSFGWMPFGRTFDVDGTMYMTRNIISPEEDVRSQLTRVDSVTGEVFPIGDPVDFNTSGGEIDACGNFFVCGFDLPALPYIWGNSSLWQVDKVTGVFNEIGDTGHTQWMDLAFDRDGVLWGTFDNELYTIDTETGESMFVTEIHDVPDAGPPHYMEVMSIAFDKHNVLYGTGLTTLYVPPGGSPVMRIDVETGETTQLGYTETEDANHGGDTMPTKVRVAHLKKNGTYKCITINMNALPAHLAHGDYVPGSAGHDCECP